MSFVVSSKSIKFCMLIFAVGCLGGEVKRKMADLNFIHFGLEWNISRVYFYNHMQWRYLDICLALEPVCLYEPNKVFLDLVIPVHPRASCLI